MTNKTLAIAAVAAQLLLIASTDTTYGRRMWRARCS